MDLSNFRIIDDINRAFTEYVVQLVEEQDRNFHLALSGGSTPERWFDYLASHYRDWAGWQRIHFYWGDERCVPPNDPESNFKMTNDRLFRKIPSIHSDQIHRIGGELRPEVARDNYEQVLRKGLPLIDGHRGFDLVILGIGTDGHVASIFPDQLHLWDDKRWCVVARHPKTGQFRISLNGALINHSKNVCFLIRGAGKANIVFEIIRTMDEPTFPAQLVKPINGHLLWFMDREAGKEIQG